MADIITQDDLRAAVDRMSDFRKDWQGIPVPLADFSVALHDRHPLREAFRKVDGVTLDILVGGPDDLGDDEDEQIVNCWYSRKHQADIYVYRRASGRAFAVKAYRSPDSSMDRLKLWMNTLGASDAWDVRAEHLAREKLRGHLNDRQWRLYDLTGTFLESSPRSGLTYLFRRSRPTVVLSPHWGAESMHCIAVLCMHPVGYYQDTWAGCMVPSDDVIAHLLFMRADEAGYWSTANQHAAWRPEAGL